MKKYDYNTKEYYCTKCKNWYEIGEDCICDMYLYEYIDDDKRGGENE